MHITINADKLKDKLNQAWNESPALCLTAAATALTAIAKLAQVNVERKNAKSWSREVKRRERNDGYSRK